MTTERVGPEDIRGSGTLPVRLHLLLQHGAPDETEPTTQGGISSRPLRAVTGFHQERSRDCDPAHPVHSRERGGQQDAGRARGARRIRRVLIHGIFTISYIVRCIS